MNSRPRKFLASAGILLILGLLTLVDFHTGYNVSVMAFYVLPIFMAVWWVGNIGGVVTVVISAVILYYIRPSMRGAPHLSEGVKLWNGFMRFLTFSFFWAGSVAMRVQLEALHKRVKLLTGILPVCGCCKKIRDEEGYWNDFEIYLREHSEADVSQKLCPDCSRKLSAGKIPAAAVEPLAATVQQAGRAPAR
jgi:hypothetical protein